MEEIDVVCYAGYKGEETPVRFTRDGVTYEILKILERSVEETAAERETIYRFRVLCSDNWKYTLIFKPTQGKWFILC